MEKLFYNVCSNHFLSDLVKHIKPVKANVTQNTLSYSFQIILVDNHVIDVDPNYCMTYTKAENEDPSFVICEINAGVIEEKTCQFADIQKYEDAKNIMYNMMTAVQENLADKLRHFAMTSPTVFYEDALELESLINEINDTNKSAEITDHQAEQQ